MTASNANQTEQGLRARLEGLARFVPIFTAPGFKSGTWHHPPPDAHGFHTFPYCSLSDAVEKFVTAAYELGWVKRIDWSAWMGRPEARAMMENPGRIVEATPDQLSKLLTVYIRGDRFNEGLVNSAFESGVMSAIAQRAEALLRELSPEGGS